MPECTRCGAFTDTEPSGEYQYCQDCQDRFAEIEQSGVVVEQDKAGGDYHIIVTDGDASLTGGSEQTQIEALARGKYIMDECGVDGLFKYAETGSMWLLEEYLQSHPNIRQDVHQRLSRVPENTDEGFLSRIKNIF
ncbi:hypothetical protein [Halorientalis salina]|uniref:hypothetical protein n=1 Tax=Halorientalis salina TaxID=2932266 RepID=UPI0010AB83CE|nr:hypothetical protein [Halorientalis salina]